MTERLLAFFLLFSSLSVWRFLHIVRSKASSFKWDYPLLSLRSFSSFLRLLPRRLVTSISPFIFPSITCFRRQFLRKMWPIQLAFPFLLIMRNISDRSCRENQNTHFMFSNFSSRKSCRLWDDTGEYDWARQATDNSIRVIWRMRVSCWISKATDSHSEYVIVAFPRQQWLRESAAVT